MGFICKQIRSNADRLLRKDKPRLLIGSPMCAPFRIMNRINYARATEGEKQQKFDHGVLWVVIRLIVVVVSCARCIGNVIFFLRTKPDLLSWLFATAWAFTIALLCVDSCPFMFWCLILCCCTPYGLIVVITVINSLLMDARSSLCSLSSIKIGRLVFHQNPIASVSVVIVFVVVVVVVTVIIITVFIGEC